MEREKEIELLMKDGCTKAEAERHLANGSAVIEDFEEHFADYMAEWSIPAEDQPAYKRMITDKVPVADWGIVEDGGKTYYIMYALQLVMLNQQYLQEDWSYDRISDLL